jgi:hypothetical protein
LQCDNKDWNKEVSGKRGEAALVAVGTRRNKYLQADLGLLLEPNASFLWNVRRAFHSLSASARNLMDLGRSTLALLGGLGTGTGLHVDWSEAYNIAFAVGSSASGERLVLAVWVFLHPNHLAEAVAWIKDHVPRAKQGVLAVPKEQRPLLSEEEVRQMHAALPAGAVVVLEQAAGDVVHVPPGWVHQVSNKQPCIKVAWDVHDELQYGTYVAVMQQIVSPWFKQHMAADYMGVNTVVGRLLGDS